MDLYIIGAGSVGGFIALHLESFGDFVLRGFIDDDVMKHGNVLYDITVVGGLDYILKKEEKTAVAIAVANPIIKKRIVAELQQNRFIQFPSFVHPTVWLGKDVSVADGCIIYPGAVVNYQTEINKFSTINMNATIGHNCSIGQYVTLSPNVALGGYTCVGNCTFIGIGASTIQGIGIGQEVTVGGMTMVTKSMPSGVTVVGNPGRIIKRK